jgi:hypothetical protein
VLNEKDCSAAALRAISLHCDSNHHTVLGVLTMTQNNDEGDNFFCTESLLKKSNEVQKKIGHT